MRTSSGSSEKMQFYIGDCVINMRTEVEIRKKYEKACQDKQLFPNKFAELDGWIEALKWVLSDSV